MWTVIKFHGGIQSRINDESLTLKVLLAESRTLLHSTRTLAPKRALKSTKLFTSDSVNRLNIKAVFNIQTQTS